MRRPVDEELLSQLGRVYGRRRDLEAELIRNRTEEVRILDALTRARVDSTTIAYRVAGLLGYGKAPADITRLRDLLRQRRRRGRVTERPVNRQPRTGTRSGQAAS